MIIPTPAGQELDEWARSVTLALNIYTSIPDIQGEDWQAWGMGFFNTPQLDNLNPPNPYQFDDWVDWGERLQDALGGGGGLGSSKASVILTQLGDYLMTQDGDYLVAQ